jgi:hypothetical protein
LGIELKIAQRILSRHEPLHVATELNGRSDVFLARKTTSGVISKSCREATASSSSGDEMKLVVNSAQRLQWVVISD